jgi:hypothetical protein
LKQIPKQQLKRIHSQPRVGRDLTVQINTLVRGRCDFRHR